MMPAGELVAGQRRADRLDVVTSSTKAIGSAPYFRLVARLVADCLGEVAADLGLAVGDQRVHGRRGEHLAVEDDRELLLGADQRAAEISVVKASWCPSPSKSRLTT